MFQEITIIGHLGKDPVSKQTKDGKTYAVTSLGCSRNLGQGRRETTWFQLTAWGSSGQYLCNYARKGTMVLVQGRLAPDPQTGCPRVWIDQSGTARAAYEVYASSVQILSWSGDEAA